MLPWLPFCINYLLTHLFWLALLNFITICFQSYSVNGLQRQISLVANKPAKSVRFAGEFQHNVELLSNYSHRTKTKSLEKNENDASAIATLAPAGSAVVAPFLRLSSSIVAENSSPRIARDLEDWEVEDFVLLATVDGTLYACDRSTGEQRWQISHEQPMVQIKYQSKSLSPPRDSNSNTIIDEYIWILEPNKDGNIYVYRQNGLNPGLVNTGLTMKMLVEMTPYGEEDPPVIYTGEKKANILTVDAASGRVLSWFGSMDSLLAKETCKIPEATTGRIKKCPMAAKIVIGHTEYTVSIYSKDDGRHIATLKLSEWSPNNYDQDLQRQHMQYATTLNKNFIYTGHDGSFTSFDYKETSGTGNSGLHFRQKFSSPVARVFDVIRPCGSDKKSTDLIILDQPHLPSPKVEQMNYVSASNIFINHTEDGSWYAISADSYPSIISGIQPALRSQVDWLENHTPRKTSNKTLIPESLIGLHLVEKHRYQIRSEIPTISGPIREENLKNFSLPNSHVSSFLESEVILNNLYQLLRKLIQSSMKALKICFLILMVIMPVFYCQKYLHFKFPNYFYEEIRSLYSKIKKYQSSEKSQYCDESIKILQFNKNSPEIIDEDLKPMRSKVSIDKNFIGYNTNFDTESAKGKKAHRGRRGGIKHKKKTGKTALDRSFASTPEVEALLPLTIQDSELVQNSSVSNIIETNSQTKLCAPKKLSGSMIQIGIIEVDTDKLIGTGSNGTMVFQGRFDGREVAVKRMLIQFFDIAFQETKLLRESDDHPNVIRYYAQQQTAGFLYIALELCPASLADIIEKPYNHPELVKAGERDLPGILYQVTNGLRHLHNLRIVHRDLKPQNILVSVDKDKKPRLVVSDFGLCKKLESEQSSFRATTAHAAGTSGWRAPELLLSEIVKDEESDLADICAENNSDSKLLTHGSLLNPRATRAIDIFSLGLIFFYVLTRGNHPFDCGDRFMREVNIRKGMYDLNPLEILGNYAYEAKELIGSMLDSDPKCRPQAHQVMAHPFFWSPIKRLNFLCDVSDQFEKEKRDPPSKALQELEGYAQQIFGNDFLKVLGKDFVESLGKQRKYTGTRLLDLLRALRNKKNHYEDLSEKLKKELGPFPDGYLSYWTQRFPQLLIACWTIVYDLEWNKLDRFGDYYKAITD
ncbi:putative serine threonine-protein kinase [Erysiphe necator]|uniref:non-specific serine/threonine protein kinase n=1 Tax=Uncinula necator TaxID=52586 RepID=A0A0B1PBV0_UNCNE|nr:putative serine threonine-protein kinase [Erysiphe necator]